MPHPRIAALLAAAVCTVALTACGQSDDRDQVRDVAARFAAALADGDGAAACELLSDATAEALEQEERAPCEQAVTELGLDPEQVARVRVYLTNAQALYASASAPTSIAAPTAGGCPPSAADSRTASRARARRPASWRVEGARVVRRLPGADRGRARVLHRAQAAGAVSRRLA